MTEKFEEDIIRRFLVIPENHQDGSIVLKTARPLKPHEMAEIQFALGGWAREELISQGELDKFLAGRRPLTDDLGGEHKRLTFRAYSKDKEAELNKLRAEVEDAPIVKLVNDLITRGIEMGASDIHFEPFDNEYKIRYRVDGHLKEGNPLPFNKRAAIVSRIKVMSELDIAERRLPQDGRIRVHGQGRVIDLRVSVIPTDYGEKAVIRILDKSQLRLDLDNLGMTPDQLELFKQNISKKHGIVLVTGPTGSGKTTTLYAALNYIKRPEVNIITIEDPIEYNLPGINQSQVKPTIGYTFASALRTYLRQDPDVIMVGEIRDRETAEIAIRASLTGHLVLSTLHTNDAPSAITRLIDIGIEPYLVSSSVTLVIAQRLIRILCEKCRRPLDPDSEVIKQLGIELSKRDLMFSSSGCDACGGFGYIGRLGVFEMMLVNDELKRAITRNADASELKSVAQVGGMKTLREIGIKYARDGIITLEEIVREMI